MGEELGSGGGRTGRNRGKRNHNPDILYEKSVFNKIKI